MPRKKRRKTKRKSLTTTRNALTGKRTKHGFVSGREVNRKFSKKRKRRGNFMLSRRGEAMKIAKKKYKTTSRFLRIRKHGSGYIVDDPIYGK